MQVLIYIMLILLIFLDCLVETKKCSSQKKKQLDECLEKVAPLMPKSGLPYTSPQLSNMCKAFKGGMSCVDKYTSSCLPQDERAELEQHLRGPRSFLAFLCDDPVFQKDYLSHGPCLRDVSKDWDRCHYHFKRLVSLQHKATNITVAARDHNICCIRDGFLSCVYQVAYFRCQKHEALFLKKVTATLSYNEIQEEKCKNVNRKSCSRGSQTVTPSALLLWMISLLLWTYE